MDFSAWPFTTQDDCRHVMHKVWLTCQQTESLFPHKQENEMEVTQAAAAAPRVRELALRDLIVSDQYHNFPFTTVTVCCLTLKNGFNVVGESACVSAELFDADVGREIAFKNAFEKLWQLEGYLLKQRVFEGIKGTVELS